MKDLLDALGVSRQALHQRIVRQHQAEVRDRMIIEKAHAIRERHPRMGCRTMHILMKPSDIGRDRCEQLLLRSGFRIKRYKNPIRTTHSQRTHRFPDLIQGLTIRRINSVWQTDITYFITRNNDVFYIVFIEDIYSRRIIGCVAHDHMRAEANLLCLNQAFGVRKGHSLRGLIHHSDYGGQYIDKEYLDALKDRKIKISMCSEAWQNAYSERTHGIIKNDYLAAWNIVTLSDLQKALMKSKNAYNHEKPHGGLPYKMSPVDFEAYLKVTPRHKHPYLKIYQYEK
jgi:putative transposase